MNFIEMEALQLQFLGLCTTQDVDIFIRHMNNARYLRELDFARFHYYGLTGIYENIKKKGGGAVQGATTVRYRRTIPIFNMYKIETELIWWDDKAIYLEQKFVTFDGFVRAVAISKQCITKVDVMELMKEFTDKRPDQPEELKMWLEAIEVSSKKLRKDDQAMEQCSIILTDYFNIFTGTANFDNHWLQNLMVLREIQKKT